MADQLKSALEYAHDHEKAFLEAYQELLSIPSISTDPARKADVHRAAEWTVVRS